MSEEYRMLWCPVCQSMTEHEDGQCMREHPGDEMEESTQIANIEIHFEMMLTDAIAQHAFIDKDMELHLKVFRLLSGYQEAIDRIKQLESETDKEEEREK